jgi:hypothetical protein
VKAEAEHTPFGIEEVVELAERMPPSVDERHAVVELTTPKKFCGCTGARLSHSETIEGPIESGELDAHLQSVLNWIQVRACRRWSDAIRRLNDGVADARVHEENGVFEEDAGRRQRDRDERSDPPIRLGDERHPLEAGVVHA